MQCMRQQKHFDFTTWDDGEINISDNWENLIRAEIEKAELFILLISPDFLTSQFINDIELPAILQKKEQLGVPIVPVIVRPTPWEVVDWLRPIQLHPSGGRPLSAGTNHEIEEGLKQLTLEVFRLIQQTNLVSASQAEEDHGASRSAVDGLLGADDIISSVEKFSGEKYSIFCYFMKSKRANAFGL